MEKKRFSNWRLKSNVSPSKWNKLVSSPVKSILEGMDEEGKLQFGSLQRQRVSHGVTRLPHGYIYNMLDSL